MNKTLHIIHNSFAEQSGFETLQRWISEDDGILFIENGVYLYPLLMSNPNFFSEKRTHFYSLIPDMRVRGIEVIQEDDHCQNIEYAEMVKIVLAYDSNKTW